MDLSSPLSPLPHAHIDANNENFSLRFFFPLDTMVFCNIFAIQMAPALHVEFLFEFCDGGKKKYGSLTLFRCAFFADSNNDKTAVERQTLNCERVKNSMVVFALQIISLITNAFAVTLSHNFFSLFASPKFRFLVWFTGAAISTSHVLRVAGFFLFQSAFVLCAFAVLLFFFSTHFHLLLLWFYRRFVSPLDLHVWGVFNSVLRCELTTKNQFHVWFLSSSEPADRSINHWLFVAEHFRFLLAFVIVFCFLLLNQIFLILFVGRICVASNWMKLKSEPNEYKFHGMPFSLTGQHLHAKEFPTS